MALVEKVASPVGVSVIICCYNSAARLPDTLKHLALQQVPEGIAWEVVLVDNASSDNTAEIADRLWEAYGSRAAFKVVSQPAPGLNRAREMGFATASHEFLILCDDDNWFSPQYISKAYSLMVEMPQVGVVGGRSEAVFEVEPPGWFGAHQNIYAVGWQAGESKDVTDTRKYVWGAGMVLRKSAWLHLVKAGFKSIVSDRMGNKLTSGGDSELCYAFILAGYRIWYQESLTLKHFIPKERLTMGYLQRMKKESVPAFVLLETYKHIIDGSCFHNGQLKSLIWLRVLLQSAFFIGKQSSKKLMAFLSKEEDEEVSNQIEQETLRFKELLLLNVKYDKGINDLLKFQSELERHQTVFS